MYIVCVAILMVSMDGCDYGVEFVYGNSNAVIMWSKPLRSTLNPGVSTVTIIHFQYCDSSNTLCSISTWIILL